MINPAQMTAPAGNEDAFANVVKERFLFELALKQLQGFPQTKMNDRVEGLTLDLFAGETGVIFQEHGLTRKRIAKDDATFLDFQSLGARHRNAQTHRNIVRDMVAADGKTTALFYRAVDIQNVVSGPSANVD